MITREEYLNALEIVDKYNRQLNSDKEIIDAGRETVEDWLFNYGHRCSTKLKNALTEDQYLIDSNPYDKMPKRFTYMNELNYRDFLSSRNTGPKTWHELQYILENIKIMETTRP